MMGGKSAPSIKGGARAGRGKSKEACPSKHGEGKTGGSGEKSLKRGLLGSRKKSGGGPLLIEQKEE